MYENLVSILHEMNHEDPLGKWIIDNKNDGSYEQPINMPYVLYSRVQKLLLNEVYSFMNQHPEYKLNRYSDILEQYDIKWKSNSMSNADVCNMDGQGVMALLVATIRAEHFCEGTLNNFFENGSIEKWLLRLKEIDEREGELKMSKIELINGSCADQKVDAVVNAANRGLWSGGGICGVIFKRAGNSELTDACGKYKTPLNDGDAVITPAFNMKNTKGIIHAVGPDFNRTPSAFRELFKAYYNSLLTLMNNGYHSISFPLISSGIFGGMLENPVAESTKQCCRAYRKFISDYPDYMIDVKLCAFSPKEMTEAKKEFAKYF